MGKRRKKNIEKSHNQTSLSRPATINSIDTQNCNNMIATSSSESGNAKSILGNDQKRKNLKELLGLFTIIASICTLIVSALKAYCYSNYYGIPISEFTSISSTLELTIIVIPPIMLGIAFYLLGKALLKYVSPKINSIPKKILREILLIYSVFILTLLTLLYDSYALEWVPTRYISYIEENSDLLFMTPLLIIFMIILAFLGILSGFGLFMLPLNINELIFNKIVPNPRINPYELFQKKRQAFAEKWNRRIKKIVCIMCAIIYMIWVLIPFGGQIAKIVSPSLMTKYEIIHKEDINYIVICDTGYVKIAMRFAGDEKITVDNTHYYCFDPKDPSINYSYTEFDSVKLLNYSKQKPISIVKDTPN